MPDVYCVGLNNKCTVISKQIVVPVFIFNFKHAVHAIIIIMCSPNFIRNYQV